MVLVSETKILSSGELYKNEAGHLVGLLDVSEGCFEALFEGVPHRWPASVARHWCGAAGRHALVTWWSRPPARVGGDWRPADGSPPDG
eukprot:7113805-Lingulodinium_polyedra.AAC.1